MSATVISGKRVRSRDTSWAAVRLPPPRSKKSSASLVTTARGRSCHSSASHTAVPVEGRRHAGRGVDGRQRPGQRVPVDLARGPRGQRVDGRPAAAPALPAARRAAAASASAWSKSSRRPRRSPTSSWLPAVVRRIAVAAPQHARQPADRVVDLAELDTAAAELDLVVGAADEDQARLVVDDQVAAAVGAVPAQPRHGGVLLGVLGRVEVAAEADSADDQLARLARARRAAVAVDHGQVPPVERQADPDRAARRSSSAPQATTVASVGP